MKFKRIHLKMNCSAIDSPYRAEPVMVPDGASRMSVQFFHNMQNHDNSPANISLLQSTDGVHFDPICDVSGNQLVINLISGSTSATLSVLGILTLWIAFSIDVNTQSTGTINSCNILFS